MTRPRSTGPARRLLLRGESAVAAIGLTLAGLLLLGLLGAAWWTQRAHAASIREVRTRQIDAAATLLLQSLEAMLARGELSAARRMVIDAAREHDIAECQVTLPDGRILADADPSRISAHTVPVAAGGAPSPAGQPTRAVAGDSMRLTLPLVIAGQTSATLHIAGSLATDSAAREASVGVAIAGVMMLVGLLMVYRTARSRLRAVGAVREALVAIAHGESDWSALSLHERFGMEAKAWNTVVCRNATIDRQALAERARQTLGAEGGGNGDLSAACDAMATGVVLIDTQGTVSYANGAAAVFLNTQRDVMTGMDVRQVIDEAQVTEPVTAILEGRGQRRAIVEIMREGDGRSGVMRFVVRPVRGTDHAAAMILIEDITQQHIATEARNSFVAQATHELRTPLTNIRLFVETAIDEGQANPATLAKSLNVINQEARRLERIVGEMLSVSEIEAGSMSLTIDDVRIETLFEQIEGDYRPQAKEKDIELALNVPPKLPVIRGDRDRLSLAIHNVIGNAIKYTPAGGSVTIDVDTDAEHMTIAVTDTGIGISDEEAERIFDKFYRAKDSRIARITGTGLGLALAREVVRLHGGEITVRSQLNKGSTFTMTLPLQPDGA